MPGLRLENDRLDLEVITSGAAIWRLFGKRSGTDVPLLREPAATAERQPLQSACFPLVPFGNRVRGNGFVFEGVAHTLAPNMAWDKHYLHGDGWTSQWHAEECSATRAVLTMHHDASGTPYVYDAAQTFALDGDSLAITLTVVNCGAVALPFGLGWHPYFPLTPRTTLQARATEYWLEGEGWMPTTRAALPAALDFNTPRGLPRHWVNNGFEGWDGRAEIVWPERQARLFVEADPLFARYFVFVSDAAFDPGYAYDFFAFEPMSHSADAHHLPGGAGLRRLAPGESLGGSVRLTAHL